MILIRQQNLQEPKVPDNRNNGAELIMSITVGREPTINQGDNAVNRSYLEQCEAQREHLLIRGIGIAKPTFENPNSDLDNAPILISTK
jgi:hypothetical protein